MHDLLVKELELEGSANSDPREYVLKRIQERLASARSKVGNVIGGYWGYDGYLHSHHRRYRQ